MINLYPYQSGHADIIRNSLLTRRVAADTSDTGTGKTAVASWCADNIAFDAVLVVCPKQVVREWERWMERTDRYAGGAYGVVNWEKIRLGRTPYVSRHGKRWDWNLPQDTLIIWDESHNAKNRTTLNAKMVDSATDAGYPQLFLSATPHQSPLDMYATGRALGLHKGGSDYWSWIGKHGCRRGRFGIEFKGGHKALEKIATRIYGEGRGSRMRVSDPGVREFFKDNIVSADAYVVNNAQDIDECYRTIRSLEDIDALEAEDQAKLLERINALDGIHDEEVYAAKLAAIASTRHLIENLRLRQRVELYKVPVFVALAREDIANGNWPVIFVNHRATLAEIYDQLAKDCPIYPVHGGLSHTLRSGYIEDFQASDSPCVLVATTPSIGTGTNLHDTHGDRPRIVSMSPGYNAVLVKQALGRIHRSGMQSVARQRLVFAADTVEEQVCKAVRKKLRNIATLNDDDLSTLAI
jgi:hypothetical protein